MEKEPHTLAEMADGQLEEDEVDLLLRPEDELKKKHQRAKRAPIPRRRKSSRSGTDSGKFKQLSFWVSREEYFALRQASLARQQAGDEPYRQEHMTRLAFRSFLEELGFLSKGAA